MGAASATITATSTKVARRTGNWVGNAPHRTAKRSAVSATPAITRFPNKPEHALGAEDEVSRRAHLVRSTWRSEDREQRHEQAIQKQEELLMLLGCVASEDGMRLAVANGELPVMPPELAVLG